MCVTSVKASLGKFGREKVQAKRPYKFTSCLFEDHFARATMECPQGKPASPSTTKYVHFGFAVKNRAVNSSAQTKIVTNV